MLKIENLRLNLHLPAGEVHAIMGPNGAGKSTLSYALAGRDGYDVTAGTITFMGEDLLQKSVEARAQAGVFLAMQYPVAIPGVTNLYFLREALNALRLARGDERLGGVEFMKLAKQKAELVELPQELLKRAVNDGFSGGEKKRNEIFQMALLEPRLALLDETDSGLDIDALRVVSQGVNALRAKDRSMLVITHYQRLLDEIVPDVVHVLFDGTIVKSGGKELAMELEEKGYAEIRSAAAGAQA